jgi:acetyltransferase-like isoleucine patch superfamily enzyme
MFEIILKEFAILFDSLNTLFLKKRFKSFGKNSIIKYGCIINHPKKIDIGKNVFIGDHVWLNADRWRDDERASLIIKDGVHISRFTHINAFKDVIIEEDVLIGENVYLGDTDHIRSDKNIAIKYQGHEFKGMVLLKSGCFICKNAIIAAGVTIGKNATVGPNAFVMETVPDYSLAIGNPARIYAKE